MHKGHYQIYVKCLKKDTGAVKCGIFYTVINVSLSMSHTTQSQQLLQNKQPIYITNKVCGEELFLSS